jgi:hypothetical protein
MVACYPLLLVWAAGILFCWAKPRPTVPLLFDVDAYASQSIMWLTGTIENW